LEDSGDASTALEMAQMSYVANDYMTFGFGKFLNPMDYFVERQHMAWVNKMPDKPLAVYDGLVPESILGLQVRGAIPLGQTKIGYALYVANAPSLNTDTNELSWGTLDFANLNLGNHVALGGRIGWYPLPELEVGYGFQFSELGLGANAYLHSADLTYVREWPQLLGTLNFHAQWVWSMVDEPRATSAPGLGFNNDRDGGYAQIAYRPTRLENPVLKNLEAILRYDILNQKDTPIGFDERRWTLGMDYWLSPSTVVKLAYEWDRQNGSGRNGQALMLQGALGF
jgi:hypothetical protein